MRKKGMSKYRLIKSGIAQNTISRMAKNKATSSETINDLCRILDCKVEDIMKYVKEENANI